MVAFLRPCLLKLLQSIGRSQPLLEGESMSKETNCGIYAYLLKVKRSLSELVLLLQVSYFLNKVRIGSC